MPLIGIEFSHFLETLRTVEIYLILLPLYFVAARLISLAAAELERWLVVGPDHGGVR